MTVEAVMTSGMRNMTEAQKQGLTSLTVLFRIGHCGDKLSRRNLSSDLAFIEPHLAKMETKGLIEMKGGHYALTAKGAELLDKMKEKAFQGVKTFEVFAGFDMDRALAPEEEHAEFPGEVHDHLFDPRFREATASEELMGTGTDSGLIDMRLAVVTWLAEKGKMEFDPFEMVFLQKLTQGYFKGKRFWTMLSYGGFFDDVEDIVNGVYQWRQIGNDDEDSSDLMAVLFRAGMNQNKKLQGDKRAGCGAPLGMFDDTLETCPSCGAFVGTVEEEEESYDDGEEEVVETTTTTYEETTETRGHSDDFLYGYEPCYDIWYVDPYDAFAVAATCAVLGACLYSDPYYW